MQWWFKKFCKGDERLGEEEHSGRTSEVGNNQLRANIEADPLKTTELVPQELNIDYSMVIWHLKQIGKVKKLDEWVASWADWKSKKKSLFWNIIFFYSMQQRTISQLDCDMRRKVDFIWWWWPTQWLDREEAPKHFPKPNLHQKKGHGHWLVVCYWSDPLQLSKPWQNHYNWEVCSANQSDAPKTAIPASVIGNRMGPILLHNTQLQVTQPTLQKLNKLGYEVLPHPPYSLDLLPSNYHFFKHLDIFLQGKCFHHQQEAENAFQEFVQSWSRDFYSTGINKLISCWQKWVSCNGSYFDLIKMCLSLVMMI